MSTDQVAADMSKEDPKGQGDMQWKRKRAPKACLRCRGRKVRCDVSSTNGPCTNCRLDQQVCNIRDRRATRSKWIEGHKPKRQALAMGRHVRTLDFATGNVTEPPVHEEDVHRSILQKPECSSSESRSKICNEIATSLEPITERTTSPPFVNPDLDLPPLNVKSDRALTTDSLRLTPVTLPAYIQPLPISLGEEDVRYLSIKGALTVPDKNVRDQLIQSFVEFIYPFMPLLDLDEFLGSLDQSNGCHKKTSLLLLQAVMFAGSASVDMEYLKLAGHQTRRGARRALFHKVKLLYDFDVETSTTHQIQALLLMTYWFESPNEQKDLWYWMGLATTLSYSSGLHHSPSNKTSSDGTNRLNRRLWWCIFMRDQLISVGMRRPARVQLSTHIPMLTLSDFDHGPLSPRLLAMCGDCHLTRDPVQRKQLAAMCIENCKLCVCISFIMGSQYSVIYNTLPNSADTRSMLVPKGDSSIDVLIRPLERQLQEWTLSLPAVCRYDSISTTSGFESNVMAVHKAVLRMLYLTAVGALYRPHILPFSPWSVMTSPVAERERNLQEASRNKIRMAATEITKIGLDLKTLDLIHLLPTVSVTAFLPAMLVQLIDIRESPRAMIAQSVQQYTECTSILQELMRTYASAELALKFLGETIRAADIQLTGLQRSIHDNTSLLPDADKVSMSEEALQSPIDDQSMVTGQQDALSSQEPPAAREVEGLSPVTEEGYALGNTEMQETNDTEDTFLSALNNDPIHDAANPNFSMDGIGLEPLFNNNDWAMASLNVLELRGADEEFLQNDINLLDMDSGCFLNYFDSSPRSWTTDSLGSVV